MPLIADAKNPSPRVFPIIRSQGRKTRYCGTPSLLIVPNLIDSDRERSFDSAGRKWPRLQFVCVRVDNSTEERRVESNLR